MSAGATPFPPATLTFLMSHTFPANKDKSTKNELKSGVHDCHLGLSKPAASVTVCSSPAAYQTPHCTCSSWSPSLSSKLRDEVNNAL